MRLNRATLNHADAEIKPSTKEMDAKPGIVHLGFGAFHRAHQALITDVAMKEFGGNWKIIGVNRGSSDIKSQMNPQDNLYSVGIGYNDTLSVHIVGAVDTILTMEEPEAVLAHMCDPHIKIVSLTVTEKGYCHHPATGEIDLTHPLIKHDLAHLSQPKSAIGYLVSALNVRRLNAIPPFTPLTCDNLPENGHVLRKVVLGFAQCVDPELHDWIAQYVPFPCSMVDRIVPRTTEDDIQLIEQKIGLTDHACVMTEPFLQWVIEDKFVCGRPAWEKTSLGNNILITNDVVPFEEMKLRLLNGSHSTIAYLGYLLGYQTVSDAMNDATFKRFIRKMMDEEITPSVHISQIDLTDYKNQLIERFENQALRHKTWQIAMDGSQKIPQRFLQTIHYALEHNIAAPCLFTALAGWMKFVSGIDEQQQLIEVSDPLHATFAVLWEKHGHDLTTLVDAFVALDSIFPAGLVSNHQFKTQLLAALKQITEHGVQSAIHLHASA